MANLLIFIDISLFIIPLGIIQVIYFEEARKRTFVMPGLMFILFLVGLFCLEHHIKTFLFPSVLLLPVSISLLIHRRQFASMEQSLTNATLGSGLF